MTAKICIVIKSFENQRSGLLLNTHKIGLPKNKIYTQYYDHLMLMKSLVREQFETGIYKQLLVIETETHQLREKLNWLKLHDLLGVQLEIIFYYQTRLNRVCKP